MQLHIPPARANSDQPLVLLEEHATNYEQATARATTAIGAIRYLSDIIATKVSPKQIDPDASIANAFRPDYVGRFQTIDHTDDERHWANLLLTSFAYPSRSNCLQALAAIAIQTADRQDEHSPQAQKLFYSTAFLLVPPPPQDDTEYLDIVATLLRTDYQRLPETKWRPLIAYGFSRLAELVQQHDDRSTGLTQKPRKCRDHLGRSIFRTPEYHNLLMARKFLDTALQHSISMPKHQVRTFEALEAQNHHAWHCTSIDNTAAFQVPPDPNHHHATRGTLTREQSLQIEAVITQAVNENQINLPTGNSRQEYQHLTHQTAETLLELLQPQTYPSGFPTNDIHITQPEAVPEQQASQRRNNHYMAALARAAVNLDNPRDRYDCVIAAAGHIITANRQLYEAYRETEHSHRHHQRAALLCLQLANAVTKALPESAFQHGAKSVLAEIDRRHISELESLIQQA